MLVYYYSTNYLLFNIGWYWSVLAGSESILGSTGLGFKVHPKLMTEALMEASDAEVVGAKVVGGQMDNEGRVKGVELEGGRVLPCDVAVLCMGPWTGQSS